MFSPQGSQGVVKHILKYENVVLQPCECDIGGSIDNNCNVVDGQCRCRPNVTGRRCDQVEEQHFVGSLDFLLFEGELATGSRLPVSRDFTFITLFGKFRSGFFSPLLKKPICQPTLRKGNLHSNL